MFHKIQNESKNAELQNRPTHELSVCMRGRACAAHDTRPNCVARTNIQHRHTTHNITPPVAIHNVANPHTGDASRRRIRVEELQATRSRAFKHFMYVRIFDRAATANFELVLGSCPAHIQPPRPAPPYERSSAQSRSLVSATQRSPTEL
jgi:hypothetical protein